MRRRRRRQKKISGTGMLACAAVFAGIKVLQELESLPGSTLLLLALLLVTLLFVPYYRYLSRRDLVLRKTLAEIDTMSGVEFEKFLANLFEVQGYEVKTTPKSGDFGADLVLSRNNVRTVVQAKRHTGKVGLSSVQEVVAAKSQYRATQALVVTNSYFTKAALNLARSNHVVLWDRDELANSLDALQTAAAVPSQGD